MNEFEFKLSFWKLQVLGWSIFFLLCVEERVHYESSIFLIALSALLLVLPGFLFSLILRWSYHKLKVNRWSFVRVVVLIIVSSFLLGFAWSIPASYLYGGAYFGVERVTPPFWYRYIALQRNLIAVMMLWNCMYFGIKYWRRSIRQTEKRLRAEFDAKKSRSTQDRIQKELEHKNRELMTKTMYLAKHNEFLITISDLIQGPGEIDSGTSREILSKINDSLSIEDQWKEFDLWFNEVHQDFCDSLRDHFPELSPREMKICAFLKLKLSSKEIADLTHLTVGTIEQYRTRLRKKLELREGENIQLFLDSL